MTPTPTPTPTLTPTPYFWPTPTALPTDTTYVLTLPPVNPILVNSAEHVVQVYNLANRYELMDTFITLILILMIIGAVIRFTYRLRRLGGRDEA